MGYVGNEPSVNFTSFAKQDITGDGGANYTLTHAVANANEIEVFVNNVRQEPTSAYSVSGTALTMTGNVASTDDFYVVYLGKAIQTTVPPDGSVTSAKLDTNIAVSGNLTVSGASTLTGALSAKGGVVFNEDSADVDFRVEGNNNTHALFVNGETDEVGIKTDTLFGDGLTITPSTASGTLSTCLVLSSGANSTSGSGARLVLTGCTNDPLQRNVVLEGKHEGNNNSISFRVYTSSDNSPVEHFRVSSNGTLTATDTTIGSNSDARLKKNIQDYSYDINKFKLYAPKTFEWINKEVHGNKENNRGFLAQDIQEIDDRWVDATDVQEDTADYNIISDNISLTSKLGEKDAMYISVIKQLIDRIETLEAKITALENS